MSRVTLRRNAWKSVARGIVICQVVLVSSCGIAAKTHRDFDFGSTPSSTQDAVLIVKKIDKTGNLGIVIDYWVLSVYSVDGKIADNTGSQLSNSMGLGGITNCSYDCVIVLLPGVHSVEVNFKSSLRNGGQNLFKKFTAAPGKKYQLGLAIGGGQWSPTITEVTN